MDRAYFLKSGRLGFSLWALGDIDIAFELLSDQEVTKYIGGPFSRPQVLRRLRTERAILRLHDIQYWPVFLLDTGEMIGYCGLRPYKPSGKKYEMGILIKKNYWNRGYSVEAALAVISYAFSILKATELIAVHNSSNSYAKSLLLRLGFEYSHQEYSAVTGQYDPAYLLGK